MARKTDKKSISKDRMYGLLPVIVEGDDLSILVFEERQIKKRMVTVGVLIIIIYYISCYILHT